MTGREVADDSEDEDTAVGHNDDEHVPRASARLARMQVVAAAEGGAHTVRSDRQE